MADAFAYCTDLVRAADRDRYIAALFAPPQRRDALCALYAFNIEVARVREAAHQALPGEIRLQWWSEAVRGERGGEAGAHPVASALLATIERYHLATDRLGDLIEARRFDLYSEPMASLADLEAYARRTSSVVIAQAAKVLAGFEAEAFSEPAGIAYAVTALLQAFPLHAARQQLYVPIELLDRHGARPAEAYAGRASTGLRAALAELRGVARRHLAVAAEHMHGIPEAALPALLPIALVRPSLNRLEGCDAFAPAELSPLRRQWLLWRAARDPTRIAGEVSDGFWRRRRRTMG